MIKASATVKAFGKSLLRFACLIFVASLAGAANDGRRTHLEWARILVSQLQPADTSYQHKHDYVQWKGQNGAANYESRTDCSGFLTALLEQAYGFRKDYFERWLNTTRPLAIDYYNAVVEQRGFKEIRSVRDVQPGDIIAIQYPPDAENSGHIMLAAEHPWKRRTSSPEIDGTEQWEVTVIDSSRSGHGKTDTRYRDDGTFGSGVGQGVFRLYTDARGRVAGYTWSTLAKSEYYDQATRHLTIGRLDLQFRP